MDFKGAVDLAILVGRLEERIVQLPEWEALRDADPELWEKCDDGYESVAVFINEQMRRIGDIY
jgi:hypothetical protein